ncbi:hypothetical protein F511_19104 [Dorcoceras hygrometricum]|uniref:Uncharacterized protein n=1 Tax=Dorcoceras hygrometricum TaxID=472368 RepID=A0A2Z7A927_9LAMI|nr:hypothetical protein F511_19104 [Dorcoceras hygrometricum]
MGAGQWAAVARTTVRDVRAWVPASGRRCRAHGCRPAGTVLAARCTHNRAQPVVNRARQLHTPCTKGARWRAWLRPIREEIGTSTSALEDVTNVSWMESPRREGRNKSDDDDRRRRATTQKGGGGREWERRGITDSACKNHSVMVSVQYGPFNTNIPIRSTTIGKSRVTRDPITMHTSRRSNSDIACVTRLTSSPDAGEAAQGQAGGAS